MGTRRRRRRRERKPGNVTPAGLAAMMSALFPLRTKKFGFPKFRFDFADTPGNALGMCLYPRKDGLGMRRTLARYAKSSGRPYRKVLDEVIGDSTAILIVDPVVIEGGGWNRIILVAIHEYAHYLARAMGSLYRWDLRADSVERTLGFLEDFGCRVRGSRTYGKEGPLFGTWCLRDGRDDPYTHDPVFYFILYFLERKAEGMGYFKLSRRPVGVGKARGLRETGTLTPVSEIQ